MARDIGEWLEGLGLDRYAEAFADNEIDLRALPHITEEDLKEMGVALGARRKMLAAIAELGDWAEPATADEMSEDRSAGAEAERRQLTVMFCDLVGSTALSRQLDPEDLREVMRRYQDAVAGAVARYEGHVAKFLGDGVLAYFGWPRAFEDQAERAVRAGLEATAAVANVRLEGDRTLLARVGIATGQVVVGDLVGTATSDAEAVSGETPNLAARLQGVAAPGQVMIGATTQRLIGTVFELEDLGRQDLKGFSEAIPVWRVIGEGQAESRFEAAHGGALVPLVGREHELGLLQERWELVKGGEGQVVLLSGEAGIGKSRLVRALRDQIGGDRHYRLRYQCSPHHTNSAFYPIIHRLQRAAGFSVEDGAERKLDKLEELLRLSGEEIDDIAPLFAALLSLPAGDRYGPLELTPQQHRDRTVEALLGQVLALSRQRPVLFVLEDAHWVDPTTETLIGEIMARVADAAVFMLITHRPDYAPPWTGYSNATSVALNRLSREQGVELIRAVGGVDLAADVIEQIVERTDGVPLFAEELTRSVLETGGGAADAAIPETLQASLMARLDRLGEAKEVAQIGAVIGREFAYDLIAAVADKPEDELDAALDRLVALVLVFRRGSPPETTYTFKHALVQDGAYESILKRGRLALHLRTAEALEEKFAAQSEAQPELLAYHFTKAGEAERAVNYWGLAGQRSLQRCANVEAVAHLRQGIELLTGIPESPWRLRTEIELQSALGVALMVVKGYTSPEVEQVYSRAKELCEEAGDKPGLFAALWGLWIARWTAVGFEAADKLVDRLLELAKEEQDDAFILQAHHAAWTTSFSRSKLTQAVAHAEQGRRLYDLSKHGSHASRYGGHDPGVCCRNFAAASTWLLGYPERARHWVEESLELARRLNHPVSSGAAHSYAALVHNLCGDPALARAEAKAALSVATEHGIVGGMWVALAGSTEASVLAVEGHGEAAIARSKAVLKGKGPPLYRPFYLAALAEICVQFNWLDDALSALDDGLALVEKTGEGWWESELHRLKGEVLLAQGGDEAVVEDCYRRAGNIAELSSARSLRLRAATSLARLWRDQDRAIEAREVLAPVYGWFTEGFGTPVL
ncbi:MAG: AAA family ATPase [Alphaproteobacteria bacterium]|nr:AAA family ATPase [Alphaproteobacteria bacterium]